MKALNLTDNSESKGFSVNTFGEISNPLKANNDSELFDESFRSLSKCSDLDLKGSDNVDINQTYRSPNSDFGDKRMSCYFKERSEPLSSVNSFDKTFESKENFNLTNNMSENKFNLMEESFVTIGDEITSSNLTLESALKVIERKNRKRKSDIKDVSMASEFDSFTPCVNSTINSSNDISRTVSLKNKSEISSGLGTMNANNSLPKSETTTHSIGLSNAKTLTLNQSLIVSPNVLSVTIGCFVTFKLDYLKVINHLVTPFTAEIKIDANVDTLSEVDIKYPKEMINIPALFNGLLTDQISITPLKFGSFTVVFQFYLTSQSINLAISPLQVICHLKSEQLVIERPLTSAKCSQISFNLFENRGYDNIVLCITNNQYMTEIPLNSI